MDLLTSGVPTSEEGLSSSQFVDYFKNSPDQFKSLNRLASQICGTPVSLVNMLDQNFQYTVSSIGDWSETIVPRDQTACQFTVENDDLLIINDTRSDSRTKNIKELVEDDSIRFYAGMPICTPANKRIGAFCVIDYEPKQLTESQKQSLRDLAKEVELRIKLIDQYQNLERKNKELAESAAFLQNSADFYWIVDPIDYKIIKSTGVKQLLDIEDLHVIGKKLLALIRDVNLEIHITDWMNMSDRDPKLAIPVQFTENLDSNKWINLTLSEYQDKLLITGRDITQRHETREQLKASLEEKNILLSEVHHRVKNNLAIISSLLQLERYNSDNATIKEVLLKSESRIQTIADIHEQLYTAKNFKHIDVEEYLTAIIENLKDINEHTDIEFDLQIADLSMNVNQALPVGLIINELVTNSIKHAFDQVSGGLIKIKIYDLEEGKTLLEVKDNGKGLDIDPKNLEKSGSLGFTLIDTLTKQLAADLEILNDDGTTFHFTFQKDDRKGSIHSM